MSTPDQLPAPWTAGIAPYPTTAPTGPVGPTPHPRSGLAIGLGLTAVIGSFLLLPLLVGPLACYFGAVARRDIEADPTRWSGAGNATTGLVLGTIGSAMLAVLALGALAVAALSALTLGLDTGYG